VFTARFTALPYLKILSQDSGEPKRVFQKVKNRPLKSLKIMLSAC